MNVKAELLDGGVYRVFAPVPDEWRQRDGLAEALRSVAGRQPVRGVVLDLGNVRYISSAGLAAVFGLRALTMDRGGQVVLARPTRSILRLLRTVNIDSLIPIATSLEEACEYLADAPAPEPSNLQAE